MALGVTKGSLSVNTMRGSRDYVPLPPPLGKWSTSFQIFSIDFYQMREA